MSNYALEQILKAQFTPAAINAQVDALNTLYAFAAPDMVPHVAQVYSDDLISREMVLNTPAVALYVGTSVAQGKDKMHGYRLIETPVIAAYAPKGDNPKKARRETEVTLEALLAIIEACHGQSFGATNRAIQRVKDIAFDTVRLSVEGSPVAYGGSVQFTVEFVTRGLT